MQLLHQIPTPLRLSLHQFLPIAIASVAVVGSQAPAQAIQFSFSYQPGTSFEQIVATELAGNVWSSYLTDREVTVNLHIAMTSGLGAGRLGGATPAIQTTKYEKVRSGLQADGTANINLLPTVEKNKGTFSFLQQDGSINHNGEQLNLTTANNKTLGNDLDGDDSDLDGYIQLEQSANWDYNYADKAIGENQYDFTSVMLHEIGHNLGFISGIDALSETSLPTALDLFRYSSESAAVGVTDYTVGGDDYFSVDGGKTREALFSTGENRELGGDGYQASHWKVNNASVLGIMSAQIGTGEYRQISAFDLKTLDYLGWGVDHNAETNLSLLMGNATTKADKIWQAYELDPEHSAIQDRSSDVEQMMERSGIYNLGYGQWWQTESDQAAQAVPEPTSLLALLGMTLFGISTHRKKGN